jgi:hypothetical protein
LLGVKSDWWYIVALLAVYGAVLLYGVYVCGRCSG